ncbi:hypothetical protein GQ53DRAFT_881898 [Thozetella sp. PMI_491]|nr:hypothetical protein GQ53DRAFT_881898 [Thozetella sp. PMI_491]
MPRSGKSKVKSGCRTCKIRKVKCDETRPACSRCTRTGRICDGYGIWGGGGGGQSKSLQLQLQNPPPALVVVPAVPINQHQDFEWFLSRMAPKLPGAFGSDLWELVIPQAAASEPAVSHAVLAMSFTHQRDSIKPFYSHHQSQQQPLDRLQQSALREYNQAIRSLRRSSQDEGKQSVRVALITCIVFVGLEYLSRRVEAGLKHLRSGLQLLQDSPLCQDMANDWIAESLVRLYIQALFFGQSCQTFIPKWLNGLSLPLIFGSVRQARKTLDGLFYRIFRLTQLAREGDMEQRPAHSLPKLRDKRDRVRAELSSWIGVYKASRVKIFAQATALEEIAYRTLHIYAVMAKIMVSTCLQPDDEMCFDAFADDFASLIAIATRYLDTIMHLLSLALPALSHHRDDVSPFIVDNGWTAPLYFTAIKCRVTQIRLEAIEFLTAHPSKEGIWDSMLAVLIACEVIRLEGQSVCPINLPLGQTATLVAQAQRVSDVQVRFSDNPCRPFTLHCSRRGVDGIREQISRQYDGDSQSWIDA